MKLPITLVLVEENAHPQLEARIRAWFARLEARAAGDELLFVDNSGRAELARSVEKWIQPPQTFEGARAELRAVARPTRISNAAAQLAAVQAASHRHVLLAELAAELAPQGIEALLACFEEGVAVAAPQYSSATRYTAHWQSAEYCLEPAAPDAAAISHLASLYSREAFLAVGGFDPLFSGAALAALELQGRLEAAGWRVKLAHGTRVEAPASSATDALVWRERERYLLTWKRMQTPEQWRAHIDLLETRALAGRERASAELLGLALALEDQAALLSRG